MAAQTSARPSAPRPRPRHAGRGHLHRARRCLPGRRCCLLVSEGPRPQRPASRLPSDRPVRRFRRSRCLTIGLCAVLPNLGASWHLHQHGVRFVRRGHERVLRYEAIDELTVKVVRVFFHDVCTGEVHEVKLRSLAPGRPSIYFKQVRRPSTVSGTDRTQLIPSPRFANRSRLHRPPDGRPGLSRRAGPMGAWRSHPQGRGGSRQGA